jgi:CBS domain-containing protein
VTVIRLDIDEARQATALMRRQSMSLNERAYHLVHALTFAADCVDETADLTAARLLTDLASRMSKSAIDLDRRADVMGDADTALAGVAHMSEILFEALFGGVMILTPAQAFSLVVANWDEIGGEDGKASWSDFDRLARESDDPRMTAALAMWNALLFDIADSAGDSRDITVGDDGLDGRRDGRVSTRDLAEFARMHPSIDAWWSDRQAQRAAVMAHALTGDETIRIVLGVWNDIGGGDGKADWGDIEAYYDASGDTRVRAAIDLLRGPLFSLIEVANHSGERRADARGRDARVDGVVDRRDFAQFLDSLDGTSVQDYMTTRGIEPPVLRVPDPQNHIEDTTIVMLSITSEEVVLETGTDLGFRVHRIIDGTYLVDQVDAVRLGAWAGVGARAELRWGEHRSGVGLAAEANAVMAAASTHRWAIRDEAEVQTLVISQAIELLPGGGIARDIVDSAADQIDALVPERVEDAVGWTVRRVPFLGGAIDTASDEAHRYIRYDAPDPVSTSHAATAEVNGSAVAQTSGLDAWIEGEARVEARFTEFANGETSWTATIAGASSGGLEIGSHGPSGVPGVVDEAHAATGSVSVERVTATDTSLARVVVVVDYRLDDQLHSHTITYDGATPESQRAGEAIARLAASPTAAAAGHAIRAAVTNDASTPGVTVESQTFSVDGRDYGLTVTAALLARLGIELNVHTAIVKPTS